MEKLYKHIILILFILLGAGLNGYSQSLQPPAFRSGGSAAQPRRSNINKKILDIKKEYMQRQLDLTPEQAVRFFPKLEEYQEDYNSVLQLRHDNNETKGKDYFSKDMQYQQQLIGIQKHYHEEFMKIMSQEKAAEVFKIEKQFNLEVMRKLKEKDPQ